MNTTEKLLLAEQARAEFERNIKALFGEHADVSICVYMNKAAYIDAPLTWQRESGGTSRWAQSNNKSGSTAVFDAQS